MNEIVHKRKRRKRVPGELHANYTVGNRFHDMKVGDRFSVDTQEEYNQLCNARAYFQKWAEVNWDKRVRIRSGKYDDNGVTRWRFWRSE